MGSSMMPWTGISGLKREMERLFDRFMERDEWPTLGVPAGPQGYVAVFPFG